MVPPATVATGGPPPSSGLAQKALVQQVDGAALLEDLLGEQQRGTGSLYRGKKGFMACATRIHLHYLQSNPNCSFAAIDQKGKFWCLLLLGNDLQSSYRIVSCVLVPGKGIRKEQLGHLALDRCWAGYRPTERK
jgi:hypothetical protein